MRRTSLLPLAVALLLAVGGCGGAEKKDAGTTPLGTSSDAPSAEPSKQASADSGDGATDQAAPFDDQGHEILRGTVQGADTPEAQAVVDAWFAYWDVRANSFGLARTDPRLGSVAATDALEDVVRYVAYLRSKKLRTVGDTTFGVSGLKVDGTSATLTSCGKNKSVDCKADGSAAETLTPYFTFEGTLTKLGGQWRVVETKVTSKNPCRV